MPTIKNEPNRMNEMWLADRSPGFFPVGHLTKGHQSTGGHRTNARPTGGHRTPGSLTGGANRPAGSLTGGFPNRNITGGVRTPGSLTGGKSTKGAHKSKHRPIKRRKKFGCACRCGHRK